MVQQKKVMMSIGTLMFLIILVLPMIIATEPTQQYNKIFLNPFYRDTMTSGTNYTYTVNVNPQDKISSVVNAILSFNAQINGQTQLFTIWVNNQSCNTAAYSVATAFSTTGNIQFYFDCSNVITKAGTYTVTLKSSVNTGAMIGWLDLTYMNNPTRDLKVFGTEYSPGDSATVFTNLLTETPSEVNSTLCQLSIFYPNKTKMSTNVMTYLSGSKSTFYYDFITPNPLGVYITESACYLPIANLTSTAYYGMGPAYLAFLNTTGTQNFVDLGTVGGTEVCSDYFDTLTDQFQDVAAIRYMFSATNNYQYWYCSAGRTANLRLLLYKKDYNAGTITSLVNVSLAGAALTNTPTLFTLPNATINTYFFEGEVLSAKVCVTNTGGAASFRFYYGTGTNSSLQRNYQGMNISESTVYRGGGEVHVTNIPNATTYQVWNYSQGIYSNILSQFTNATWNYTGNVSPIIISQFTNGTWAYVGNVNPNILSQFTNSSWNYSGTIIPNILNQMSNNTWNSSYPINPIILSQITNSTWNYAGSINPLIIYQMVNGTWNFSYPINSNILSQFTNNNWNYSGTVNPIVISQFTNGTWAYTGTINSNILNQGATSIWNYVSRNLTYTPDMTNYSQVAIVVWNYVPGRNLTYYQDFTNNTLTASVIWNFPVRNLTYYQDVFNYTLAAQTVWNFQSRNLTYYQDVFNYTLMPQLIWNYVSRNLTYTPDMTNYFTIQGMVWNATNRNLTYYNMTDVTDYNLISQVVWNFTSRNLTYYNLGNNLSASDVWNYVSRNLTFYQDVTNYSLSAQTMWSYNNRTLTFYQVNNISTADIWGYLNRSLTENVSQEVWLYQSRNLTYYPDMTNYTLGAQTIWSYVNRSLTEDIPFEVWTYSNRTTTNNQNISLDVWTYYNRSLTYYPDVTDYSLIWNFPSRNLTYYQDVTNYTLIPINVWNYSGTINSNILTQIASAIWNYAGTITTITNQISSNVWSYTARYTHGEILD